MPRFTEVVEQTLRRFGWFPGRMLSERIARWKEELSLSDGFEMFAEAEKVLSEFGGIDIDQRGPGRSCALEPFCINPTLALREAERFAIFSKRLGTKLYPLGEAAGGYYYLAVGEDCRVFLLMEDLQLIGESIEDALENLIMGNRPQLILE